MFGICWLAGVVAAWWRQVTNACISPTRVTHLVFTHLQTSHTRKLI